MKKFRLMAVYVKSSFSTWIMFCLFFPMCMVYIVDVKSSSLYTNGELTDAHVEITKVEVNLTFGAKVKLRNE